MAFDAEGSRFTAVTSSGRALGTTYTNGPRRRWVIAAVKFPSGTAASVTYTTTVAKQTLSAVPVAAVTATETIGTLTFTGTFPFTFPVDPGGSYSINVATGSATVASWVEVDL